MSVPPDETAAVIQYHERTEHRLPNRYAPALGYLDWATQPDPFRSYEGAERLELPIAEPLQGPSWATVRSSEPIAPAALNLRSLSQLFYDSMAISAWKQAGRSRWALRCNPSSGNLHPTEAYVLSGPIADLIPRPALLHYAPREHAMEVRRWLPGTAFDELSRQLPATALVIGLSTIVWREAWKYGERAFRYCNHDVGHAIQAISLAARTMGWRARRLEGLDGDQMDRLLALAVPEPSSAALTPLEAERSDVLLVIEPIPEGDGGPVRIALTEGAIASLCPAAIGTPNRLSSEHHDWPVLEEVERATRERTGHHAPSGGSAPAPHAPSGGSAPAPQGELDLARTGTRQAVAASPPARTLFRQRRSAVDFDGATGMSRDQLYQLSRTLVPALAPSVWTSFPYRPRVHPVMFLHRVEDLAPGLAILVRDPAAEPALRAAISLAEDWIRLPGCPEDLPLYGIAEGDSRRIARAAHCHQDIAADGALVVSMIASFDDELARFGPATYRHLHWETGAVGQLLYLEAEAISLSATGIGCFFDHAIHEILGLSGGQLRMLYGTAIGRAVHDSRIQTLPAYARAESSK